MAYIITVATNKGGTGKTTTAINSGFALRNKGYDVLLIDLDGQTNLTYSLRIDNTGGTMYDVMGTNNPTFIKPVEVLGPEVGAGVLDVIPSCYDLSAIETEIATHKDRVTRLRSFIEQYRDKYDYIIIDTPPSVGILTINALYATDAVIVPVKPEFLAVQGLLAIQERIKLVSEYRGDNIPYRVLFTAYEKRKGLHRMTTEQVEASGFDTFKTRIRANVALGEAPAVGTDIFRYAPNSYGAQDYNALCSEVMTWHKVRHTNHKRK